MDSSGNVPNSEHVNSVTQQEPQQGQENTQQAQQQVQQQEQQTQTLKNINIDNENIALNVLVGMINIAQKRGAYNLEESAKAWECVQMFMKNAPASA